jgi:hypothetical protein
MEAALGGVADRFNLDGFRKAIAVRGAAWTSPARRAGGDAPPAPGTPDELLQYDSQALGCSLLKLPAELASKARAVCGGGSAAALQRASRHSNPNAVR